MFNKFATQQDLDMCTDKAVSRIRRGLSLISVCLLMGAAVTANAASKTKLSIYTTGTAAVGLPCTPASPSAVLMGGGTDVSQAYTWMINKANCGTTPVHPGNVVVLRSSGNGDYDKYIYKLGSVAAVQTLVVPNRDAANDPALTSYLQNAAVVWIAGGDQSVYYAQWKGTLLENLLQQQIRNYNIPFGGTSAGLMMLGNFNYVGGATYSVTSTQALANPYNAYMTLKRDFWSANAPSAVLGNAPLSVLLNTVTDSHFNTRDRMGRTLAFMARNLADGWVSTAAATITNEHAIAVDEQTAVLVETDTVSGNVQASIVTNPGVTGYAYFMNTISVPMCDATSTTAAKPLDPSCTGTFTMSSTPINRLTGTSIRSANLFDLGAWRATPNAAAANFLSYSIDVNHGVLNSTGNDGSIY